MHETVLTEEGLVIVNQRKRNFQEHLKATGITTIILAIVTIAFSIAAVSVSKSRGYYWCSGCHLTNIGAGIWGSIFVIPTGILIIICGIRLTSCLLTWTFMSAILSSIFNLITVSLAFAAAISSADRSSFQALVALNIVVFAVSLAQMVLSLYICSVFARMICSNLHIITVGDMCGTCCDCLIKKPQAAFHYISTRLQQV